MLPLALTTALLLSTYGQADAPTAEDFRDAPDCAFLHAYDPGPEGVFALEREIALLACRLPQPGDAETLAGEILQERRFGFRVEGDVLTIAANPADGEAVSVTGALPGAELDPAGEDGLFLSRFRLAHLDEGVLGFYLFENLQTLAEGEDPEPVQLVSWRGPNAPAEPEFDPELQGTLEEVELWSEALGETRRLVIYTPPGFDPEGEYPAVFFADGGKVQFYARYIEPMIREGRVEPLVLVGARSGQGGIVEDRSDIHRDMRNADYIPGFVDETPRFDQHMEFFAEELVSHAVEAYAVTTDRRRRAVTGRSSGGAFAFLAGVQRPDAFGLAFPMSGGWGVEDIPQASEDSAIFRLASGRYEMSFMLRARRSVQLLAPAGYDIELQEISAGHTQEIDDYGLLPLLQEFFPASQP